jgi:hypothetical protein
VRTSDAVRTARLKPPSLATPMLLTEYKEFRRAGRIKKPVTPWYYGLTSFAHIYLFFEKVESFGGQGWRRGESNPCPNISFKSFLHVYTGIDCRKITGTGQTDDLRSWMVLSNRHSLLLQQPLFVFESAAGLGKRQTGPAAQMTT